MRSYDLIETMLSPNSKIFVNGVFTRTFKNLKIGVLDISEYPVHQETMDQVEEEKKKYFTTHPYKRKLVFTD